ncbi:uncharacterized protein EAF01_005374 [Botrytis porri]|uniref:uncharacterized protein n=1 Tax=Botrytis porri TaxID=87229 RepID=UPI0019004BC9|nr:uncharacterized protein EAF01_005374 [Botrytis porri]KAF7907788.1 hypothetical protein EAF01_005374 [Botrytis porri]
MSASLPLLRQSSRLTSPRGVFRFLDLPGEIRNKIYEMATCDIEEPEPLDSMDTISLPVFKQNFNLNLLLTCRQIHDEAKYVMMTKNLYVEVQLSGVGRRLNNDFTSMLCLYRIPVIRIKTDIDPEDRSFDGCVIRYRVSCDEPRSVWERESIDSLVILHRHMNQFLEAINQTQWFVSTCTQIRSYHDITLQNPFVSRSAHAGDSRSQLSIQALQNNEEALLSPFSTIKEGPMYISRDWSGSHVQHNNTRPPIVTSISMESVLKDLDELIRKGRDHHLQGIYVYAEGFYKLVDYKITILMNSLRNIIVTRLYEREGLEPEDQVIEGEMFENQLAEIYSTVCYHRAQNALAEMRHLMDNGLGQHSLEACDIVHQMASQARAPLAFPQFIPNLERTADHIFMEAVSFRLWAEVLSGDRYGINQALVKVELGLEMAPNHPGLRAEKYRIVRQRLEPLLNLSVAWNVAHP